MRFRPNSRKCRPQLRISLPPSALIRVLPCDSLPIGSSHDVIVESAEGEEGMRTMVAITCIDRCRALMTSRIQCRQLSLHSSPAPLTSQLALLLSYSQFSMPLSLSTAAGVEFCTVFMFCFCFFPFAMVSFPDGSGSR